MARHMRATGLEANLVLVFVNHLHALYGKSEGAASTGDEVILVDVEREEDVDASMDAPGDVDNTTRRLCIKRSDLDYSRFLHAIAILCRTLLGSDGRSLFPVRLPLAAFHSKPSLDVLQRFLRDVWDQLVVPDSQGMTLVLGAETLSVVLLRLVYRCKSTTVQFGGSTIVSGVDSTDGAKRRSADGSGNGHKVRLSFANFVCNLLRDLASRTELLYTVRENCIPSHGSSFLDSGLTVGGHSPPFLHQNVFLEELVVPVRAILQGEPIQAEDESLLNHVAAILSSIASTERGRKFLLNPTFLRGSSSRQIPAPLDCLVKFAQLAVDSLISSKRYPPAARGFVFVLRQLYRTPEGIALFEGCGLHHSLSKALGSLLSSSQTGPCTAYPAASVALEAERIDWVQDIKDNLLNFAATPRGVMLLENSGAMKLCVAYMFQRCVVKCYPGAKELILNPFFLAHHYAKNNHRFSLAHK
jgi:hypothetical protein